MTSSNLSVISEADGLYRCLIPRERLMEGLNRLSVSTEHPQYGQGAAESEWPVGSPLVIQWTAKRPVTLSLPGALRHRETEGFAILLQPFRPEERKRGQVGFSVPLAQLDDQERLVFPSIADGEYTVSFQIQRDRTAHSFWAAYPLGRARFSAAMPATSLPFPLLGSLVVDAAPGEDLPFNLSLSPVGGLSGESSVIDSGRNSDGRNKFPVVPYGNYELKGYGNGVETVIPVRIAGAERITWKSIKPDALLLRVDSPAGVFAQAGFADGDLSIGVDGEELTSDNLQEQSQRMVFARGPIPITLRRGGQVVTLTVDFKAFRRKRGDAGGEMKPTKR